VVTGVSVKFFLSTTKDYPSLPGMEYLVYSTVGGTFFATTTILILKWYYEEKKENNKAFSPLNKYLQLQSL